MSLIADTSGVCIRDYSRSLVRIILTSPLRFTLSDIKEKAVCLLGLNRETRGTYPPAYKQEIYLYLSRVHIIRGKWNLVQGSSYSLQNEFWYTSFLKNKKGCSQNSKIFCKVKKRIDISSKKFICNGSSPPLTRTQTFSP